ncbi:hypothetical protein TEQG_00224 [Trichophyton equinum CBS 127.97]|uniref:Uncharacterized protein n=1 Tax=Trichophyton equinum (strain ATCC MYA-4606 / CBS 127.97) TaxID=559882 RepID=F2PH05_TRIEC|nr:hypothetical protein TEQG_00224 [Trichophyton equinum CBS 127.97]
MVYNPDCKGQAEVDQQQRNIKYIIIYANNVPCAMNHNKTGQADTRFLRSTACPSLDISPTKWGNIGIQGAEYMVIIHIIFGERGLEWNYQAHTKQANVDSFLSVRYLHHLGQVSYI